MIKVIRDKPYVPYRAAVCIMVSENPHTVPSRFHGNPVKIKLLIHSIMVHIAAKPRILLRGVLKNELPNKTMPLNKPKKPPLPMKILTSMNKNWQIPLRFTN